MRILRVCFEIRTVHPHAGAGSHVRECVFLILIVDILCLDALLADSLLVHQHRQLSEKQSGVRGPVQSGSL